jgi:Putative periplasmic protein kinase ArgK and related GTPases of G3E family
MLLCEAAGFEVIIIETVGVGQSEIMVKDMVDFFLLLMLAGAGDELQGIKKGIMEMADGIAITKVENENLKKARQAQADLEHALHLFQASDSGWQPKVLLTSALENKGILESWKMINQCIDFTKSRGFFEKNRKQQNLKWFRESIGHLVQDEIRSSKSVTKKMKLLEDQILKNEILAPAAARELIKTFFYP